VDVDHLKTNLEKPEHISNDYLTISQLESLHATIDKLYNCMEVGGAIMVEKNGYYDPDEDC
jgi:hypothetical protein